MSEVGFIAIMHSFRTLLDKGMYDEVKMIVDKIIDRAEGINPDWEQQYKYSVTEYPSHATCSRKKKEKKKQIHTMQINDMGTAIKTLLQ